MIETDYLVVGSGIAGLTFALYAADHGDVVITTKRLPDDANTSWAQGGIAAVLDKEDSFEAHIDDTLTVGEGLCKRAIVELCVKDGPSTIAALVDKFGVHFDREDGEIALAREGGHSARRVAHHKDTTGRSIEDALLAAVAAHVHGAAGSAAAGDGRTVTAVDVAAALPEAVARVRRTPAS